MSNTQRPESSMSLRQLCEVIEKAYADGRTMFDPCLTALAEELTSRTGEIKQRIDDNHNREGLAVPGDQVPPGVAAYARERP